VSGADAASGGFAPKPFEIYSETGGTASIVSAQGEIDLRTAPRLEAALLAAENRNEPEVIVDLCEVDFIDSSALRVLILSSERLKGRGKELHLAYTPGAVSRVFDMAAINERFAIYESREEAVAAVGSR
jgi:anti-sigma B factor antagonist